MDMPCICNNGRGGAVDGRQPSLPVGATAVIPGLQRGRATPCLVLWRPPAAVFPAALCGSWSRHGSAARASCIRRGPGAGVLRHSSALCWKPGEPGAVSAGCVQRGFSTSACTWAPVVIGRSGRQPLRVRGLTAVRGLEAWVARESLRRGGCLLGCLVLPPRD